MIDKSYWIVGGDETRVWSGAASAFVMVDDADYLAWRLHNFPTRIVSEAELCDVINVPIIAQISEMEARQARPLREISLGVDVEANQQRLIDLDAEIATLRASLHAVTNA